MCTFWAWAWGKGLGRRVGKGCFSQAPYCSHRPSPIVVDFFSLPRFSRLFLRFSSFLLPLCGLFLCLLLLLFLQLLCGLSFKRIKLSLGFCSPFVLFPAFPPAFLWVRLDFKHRLSIKSCRHRKWKWKRTTDEGRWKGPGRVWSSCVASRLKSLIDSICKTDWIPGISPVCSCCTCKPFFAHAIFVKSNCNQSVGRGLKIYLK